MKFLLVVFNEFAFGGANPVKRPLVVIPTKESQFAYNALIE